MISLCFLSLKKTFLGMKWLLVGNLNFVYISILFEDFNCKDTQKGGGYFEEVLL